MSTNSSSTIPTSDPSSLPPLDQKQQDPASVQTGENVRLNQMGQVVSSDTGLPPLETLDPVKENVEREDTSKDSKKEKKKPKTEKVKEKVIIREKKVSSGGGGISLPGCGCRSCSCFGCLFFIIIIVAIFSILYFRPSIFWNPIKTFLNAGEAPPVAAEIPPEVIRDQAKTEIESSQQTEISEKELQSLVRDKLDSDVIRVDIEPNFLMIYTNIDTEEKPLWVVLEMGQNTDNKLEITKVGFGRFGIPEFFRDFLTDNAFVALSLAGASGDDDAVKLLNEVLETEEKEYTIEKVRFDKDKVTISQ